MIEYKLAPDTEQELTPHRRQNLEVQIALLRRILLNADVRKETQSLHPDLKIHYFLEIKRIGDILGMPEGLNERGQAIETAEQVIAAADVRRESEENEQRALGAKVEERARNVYWDTTSALPLVTPGRLTRREKS